jgi:putative phosphoribosyl transferase
MYFASRVQAGRMIAKQLLPKYRYENCAVVALDPGGVVVGAQVASQLHCPLHYLLNKNITLPRENDALATIAQDGTLSYNGSYSESELGELRAEFFQYIEQEKMQRLHEMHELMGPTGTIRKDLLKGRYIILVTDGMQNGHVLDLSEQYLTPVATEGIVVATPLASPEAVDYMHVLADDICCLSVVENYLDTPHYYDKQDVPSEEKIIEIIEKIVLNWK